MFPAKATPVQSSTAEAAGLLRFAPPSPINPRVFPSPVFLPLPSVELAVATANSAALYLSLLYHCYCFIAQGKQLKNESSALAELPLLPFFEALPHCKLVLGGATTIVIEF